MFALAAGFGIHLGGIGIGGEMPGLPFRVLWAVMVGSITAAILETLGRDLRPDLRYLTVRTK